MDAMPQKIVITCLFCKSLYRVSKSVSGKPVTCSKCRRSFLALETQVKKPSPEDEGFLLCKLALHYGLITEKRLKVVLAEYARLIQSGNQITVDALLITHGGLTGDNYKLLKSIRENWDLRQADKRFAAEAVEKGFISKEKSKEALDHQAKFFHKTRTYRLLCDILMESGDLSPDQCDDILKGKQSPKTHPEPVITPMPQVDVPKVTNTPKTSPAVTTVPDVTPARAMPPAAPIIPEKKEPPPAPVQSAEPVVEIKTQSPEKKNAAENKADIAPPPQPSPDQPVIADPASPIIPGPRPEPRKKSDPPAQPTGPAQVKDAQTTADVPFNEPVHTLNAGDRIVPIQGLELILSLDGLLATLKVPDGVDPSSVPVNVIKATLIEEDIVYGIAEDSLIRGFLNSKVFREKPFTIAEGIRPRPGKPGNIRYFFDTNYLKIGAINETGNIDFKNRGEIPYVEKGTLLAEITPAIPGKDGRDIYGRDIPVPDIRDVTLRCESGTELSENKTKVFASVSGQPKLNFGDRIQVLSELTIPGDVGFETGHIEFEGNIIIKGTVQPDFTVKGANITANEVVGATIIARGDLVIKNGVTNSILTVEGNVQAKFIHKCTINAYGNVVSDKEIIDCQIENSGACLVERGKIISSSIASKLGVTAKEIGTEMSSPCHIRIGVDDHIAREVDIIDEHILTYKVSMADMEQALEDLLEKERDIQQQITTAAHVQDRSQLEQNGLRKTLERLGQQCPPEKIKEIEQQIAHLAEQAKQADESINKNFDKQDEIFEERDRLKASIARCKDSILDLENQKKDKIAWAHKITGAAYVKTTGAVYTGTLIGGVHCTKKFKETMRCVRMHESRSPDSAEGWEMRLV